MASLAEKRMEELEDIPRARTPKPRRGRRNCGCSRRCCLPPPSRSTRRRWPSACRTASTSRRRWRSCRPNTRTRGVNLVRVASKWTFRTAGDLSWLMTRESTETRRLSRAAIEMLAIIAYHQPVTRAEIEEIRGVDHLEGHARRAAGDRLDPAARPPQDAGPAADLRHHRSVPVAVQPGSARRPAGPRRAEGHGPARFAAAGRLHRADAVGRRRCARTRTRSKPAILDLLLAPAAEPEESGGTGSDGSAERASQAALTVAIIRSRDSDLPRHGSLFLTPPGPSFRESLAGSRPSLFGGLQDGFT